MGRLKVTMVLLLRSVNERGNELDTGEVASPVAHSALDVSGLGNVQNRATDSAKFDVVDTNVAFLKVLDEGGHDRKLF